MLASRQVDYSEQIERVRALKRSLPIHYDDLKHSIRRAVECGQARGMTMKEIAFDVGLSRQRLYQVLGWKK